MTKKIERNPGRSNRNQDKDSTSFDTPVVSEEVYWRIRGAVEAKYPFVLRIRPLSVEDVLREDEERAVRGEERVFEIDGVDPSEAMRTKVPPEIEIAINPLGAKIERSHELDTDGHKKIITEEDDELNISLSEDLQGLARVRMPTTSMIVQVYKAYKEQTGHSLFEGWFARAADELSTKKGLARVGKYPTDKGMRVRGPDGRSVNDVYAMAVVILPRR